MEIEELLAAQAGVVTPAQLHAAGVSGRQLRPGGSWLRLRQGAYAPRRAHEEADLPGRAALGVAAERLVTGVDQVAVGEWAAALHGLPLLGRLPVRPTVAERKEVRPLHHGRSRRIGAVVEERGVPVLAPALAAADVARRQGLAAGLVTADALLRRGPEPLAAAARSFAGWPGARTARLVAQLADGRSESPLESLGRARFVEQGLPPCDLQVVVGDAYGPIARVDHAWLAHRTVAEADGALKYTSPEALFAEKRREDRLREAGFEVVRYTWDEALRSPALVAARVRAAFARAAVRQAA